MSEALFRIVAHPHLGPPPAAETIQIIVDGEPLEARAGEPVAATLLAHGRRVCRTTIHTGEPRGVFCAIGLCGDCTMQVDGVPGVRVCVTPVRAGMRVETQRGLGVWNATTTR
ncbi:MAG: (2Fe-2S)-binding protein [Thermomicrobia bacterium]|nr:(2Fe-2S)-binding protein [Thermomicrobia bacterium]